MEPHTFSQINKIKLTLKAVFAILEIGLLVIPALSLFHLLACELLEMLCEAQFSNIPQTDLVSMFQAHAGWEFMRIVVQSTGQSYTSDTLDCKAMHLTDTSPSALLDIYASK